MWKSIALAALIIPAVVYTTYKEWQHLGFWNFSDEEGKQYVADLGESMAEMPDVVGDWKYVEDTPVNLEQIRVAKITKFQARKYQNKTTGAEVTIFLSTGPRGDICIHTPAECNPGAGNIPVIPDLQVHNIYQLDETGEPKNNLGSFVWQRYRSSRDNQEFEIWWSYNETGKWEGEKNPRMAFTKPGLYKLYVTDVKQGNSGGKKNEPPQMSFLRAFIPELNQRLFRSQQPTAEKVAAK